jgi:glucose/arabinose dehydrogenase
MHSTRRTTLALVTSLIAAGIAAQDDGVPGRKIDVGDFDLPAGYLVEAVVANLSVPTTAVFDGGDLLIAESGFKNTAAPRVLRVTAEGRTEVLAQEGLQPPVTGLLVKDGVIYVSHLGKVSIVGPGGTLRDIVAGLPSEGDHQNNQMALGADGKIYLGQGTTTNSGVVGLDNQMFGWLSKRPSVHEVPCRDVILTGQNVETDNPLRPGEKAVTGAYKPFGTPSTTGEVIKGNPRCGGSIVRFGTDGSGFELVAWGLRNPFGLEVDRSGALWATSHGADVRGSRPVFNDPDFLVRVEPGAWYGWPDYFDGEPATARRFNAPGERAPKLLWQQHPPLVRAFATFPSHSGAGGFAFSPGGAFGYEGDAFVAEYGTFAPVTTGVNLAPAGFRVSRVDMKTRTVETFARNDLPGPAYVNLQHGFDRPTDVVFAGDSSLYVVDWGASTVDGEGLKLVPRTGVVFRIYRDGQPPTRPGGPVNVPAAEVRKADREPLVPNTAVTYKQTWRTLAAIGAVVASLLLIGTWLLRRRRARP